MKHRKRIKQKIIACLLVMGILLAGSAAQAKPYAADGFTIEIPDGTNVYYYTPRDTNMTDESMLESAQSEPDVVFLTGVYTKDDAQGLLSLAYSLKIVRTPAQTGEDETQQRTARLQELTQQLSEGYTFTQQEEEELAGQPAARIDGDSMAEAYSIRIYTTLYDGSIYTVTLIYKQAEDDQYLNGALAQLRTLTFGVQTAVSQQPAQAAVQTETPSSVPPASASPQASANVPDTGSAMPLTPIEEDTSPPAVRFLADNLLLVCVGVGIIVLAVTILILILRLRRQKQRNIQAVAEMQSVADAVPRQPIFRDEIHPATPNERPIVQEAPRQEKEETPAEEKTAATNGLWTQGAVEEALRRAYALKGKKDYIYAAKQFNDAAKHADDVAVKKAAEMQVIKCLISAKQPAAALKKAQKAIMKDYGYTIDERVKLKSIIQILKKQTGGNRK